MIILSKNKIYTVMMCFAFALLTFYIGSTIKSKNTTLETVALPVANKVIVLDAGHGKPDERSRE